ncbi:MAG: HDIG domain-containing protein [Paraprevotella sp.]|nr:HDIG domain-containing protein [Paraprevotella sp.]
MSRFNHKKDFTLKDIIFLSTVTLTAIFLIVLFLPRENRSQYQFDLGRPWRHSPLIATFDFPIYKSTDILKREQDSVLRFYEPYFEINPRTSNEQIEKFRRDYQGKLQGILPHGYKQLIETRLQTIYKNGLIRPADYEALEKDSIRNIRVFTNNQSSVHAVEDIFSHKKAYEYLTTVIDTQKVNRYILQRCNLDEYLTPNLKYDPEKSEQLRKELINSVPYASGMVLSGQKIIDRGELVDTRNYDIIVSFEKESTLRGASDSQATSRLLGQILYVTTITLCMMAYFCLFRRDYMDKKLTVLLLLSLYIVYPILTASLIKHNLLNVYLIPYVMAPIIIRMFMDSRTAFFIHSAIILLCAVSLKYPYEFIATQSVAGMAAIYSLSELSRRAQMVKSALIVTLTAAIFYLALELVHENELSHIEYATYIYIGISGILLLFTYPILFVIEKLFAVTSNITLIELSMTNNEILRKMSEVAPGTLQHSMQVANLAEEVANKIGAKSQLVRTGAMYHDIGKICNPAFFTENQNGVNPHDKLSYDDSAKIIINHVRDGLKLAEKHHLPAVIKEFITTHHGKGKTKYFYISYKNQHPDSPVDETVFTYPGPNPSTQEQAILMMADAVEAASRSLPEYTEESIGNLVENIIDTQVKDGNFKECPITFLDIHTAKEVFKEKLKIIYHTRISYPELKKQ